MLKSFPNKPLSRKFGFDLGTPIDRFYIEEFLNKNRKFIKNTVVEVAEDTYTKKFGGNTVKKSIILSGNLETGEGIASGIADCFICTQTLLCIFDLKKAAKNCIKLLKPGGVLLLTVPGITQISRYDMNRWGHYWSFTDLAVKTLFESLVPKKYITVETYGNVKVASAFLYGYPQEKLTKAELSKKDPDYQLLVAAAIKKPNA